MPSGVLFFDREGEGFRRADCEFRSAGDSPAWIDAVIRIEVRQEPYPPGLMCESNEVRREPCRPDHIVTAKQTSHLFLASWRT